MDSSRRAVESYWRSRTIDAATSDEDKVTPVYKLEEICDLLRSSHVGIVKELSSFILKRLDHKSPIVKQKALRLIKYAVGKSGAEFRREMQRHSAVVRQLFHYKGQPDPLKGDALNKAVRETAHEAISAIFSEENKPPPAMTAPVEGPNSRIQGFGSTNYEMPPGGGDKKSFLSEVVGIGSASIKQGITNLRQSHAMKKGESGGPNLHRSLTMETAAEYSGRYEPPADYRCSSETMVGGPWGQDSGSTNIETENGNSSMGSSQSTTPEAMLLETIVASGGVRLQPTRDAIQIFLSQAVKLNGLALSQAIESKLQNPKWQVRMKAVCVLESVLRKNEDEPFSVVASYFIENGDAVVKCSESPQSSLREKAIKVLSLLGGEPNGASANISEKAMNADTVISVPMPDLIDTRDPDDFNGNQTFEEMQNDQFIGNLTATPPPPLIDDLFGDGPSVIATTTSELKTDDDPFADVSFHTNEGKEPGDDLFTGMTLDGKQHASESHTAVPGLFDIFGSDTGASTAQVNKINDLDNIMGGLSINENGSKVEQKATSLGVLPQSLFSELSSQPAHPVTNDAFSGVLGPQASVINANFMIPQGAIPYNTPSGMMYDPAFAAQQINYGAMGNIFAQHLAAMSSYQQQLGNLTGQNSSGVYTTGSAGSYSPALPDIFQANYPSQVQNPTLNAKKEDTKAFDFISDHIAAARDPKRLI